jgi:tripartite ATP-independent transporter DctM subunit
MIVLFGTFILLILIKMPIAFTLFISSIVYMLVNDMSVTLAIQRIAAGPDSFPLLAVPGFILAGAIMNTGGVTQRIFGFASKCLGHLPGGLGHANILASIIFAGMSGSAIADAGGLGAVELKAMKDAGYDEDFSLAVTGASSTIGPIIPPSIPAVLYGVTAGVSIGRLFAGGFIPGFIMGGALSVFVHFYGKRKGYARTKKASFKELWDSLVAAFFPLITPLIIVGGIV